MASGEWLTVMVFVVGVIALIGFFVTKSAGFGRFATSTFLLVVVLVLSSLLFASGKLDATVAGNIFFAVIGFAGGLFSGKERDAASASGKKTSSADPQGGNSKRSGDAV